MTRLTDQDLKEARKDADGFAGRFAWISKHGCDRGVGHVADIHEVDDQLVFVPNGADESDCEHWHVISNVLEQHVAESIARMLNTFPRLLAEVAALKGELANHREVADPDGEHPELSTRDCIMHLGEQAALLASVNRMAEKRGAERDEAQAIIARLTEELNAVDRLLRDIK